MLRPANVVDLPVLRALIRDGAAAGSFERELATESGNGARFFSNLRQALATGYFVEEDPRTGRMVTFAAPAYVYVPDGDSDVHRPIGFGLFKATAVGYELWLTGIDAASRGQGHGRALLAALLETPPGRLAYVVRVENFGASNPALAHLLQSFGYSPVRESRNQTWYLRSDAPRELRAGADAAKPSPHSN
jgi:ribosomal protein S18 acetylase RimI-like enzyme